MRLRGHIPCRAQKKLVQNSGHINLKEREESGKATYIWRENAKMDLTDIGWEGVYECLIRLVNIRVSHNTQNLFLTSSNVSFSKATVLREDS
jgi:hypothetical protein